MQAQDYPLYAVLLGSGKWAVCCESCGTTVTICETPADAARLAHNCTPAAELPPGCPACLGGGLVEDVNEDVGYVYTACLHCGGSGLDPNP